MRIGHTRDSFRAWVIGIFLAIVLSAINQLLFFRYPAPSLGPIVAQLVSYPLGRAAAALLPRKRLFGLSLNPGPFTIKVRSYWKQPKTHRRF